MPKDSTNETQMTPASTVHRYGDRDLFSLVCVAISKSPIINICPSGQLKWSPNEENVLFDKSYDH